MCVYKSKIDIMLHFVVGKDGRIRYWYPIATVILVKYR